MLLTILGSGTALPDGERNSAGYFLQLPSANLMLDCGAGTLHALARFGLPWQDLSHLFVSHFHLDHVGELASLLFAFKLARKTTNRTDPLVLIGPVGLTGLMSALSAAYRRNLLEPGFPVSIREIAPGEQVALSKDCYLSVAKTPHTDESLGVRVDTPEGSLCYTGDTAFSADLAAFFKDATLLIAECSLAEHPEGVARMAHLSIGDAARMAAIASARRLVVTHFYFKVAEARLKAQLAENYGGQIHIARDGMRLEI
jgi:ribonuclease BN (tRNA processing enzyme)